MCNLVMSSSVGLSTFLLAGAVYVAQPQDEIAAIDADNSMLRKNSCKQVKGDAIVWIVECRNQYHIIANQEIRIACWQNLPVEQVFLRHRQFYDIEVFAILI